MSNLLSRYADATFWMGRQIERAEDLARILDVNESFSRDAQGAQNWQSVLRLYADEERYLESHREISANGVLNFYVRDRQNPGSIFSNIRAARENARQLRPIASTEMWRHLNVFFGQVREIDQAGLSEQSLNRICSFIKEGCQMHTGIVEGTFYRDEGWYFYQLGALIERADQTTRLLDVKYELLLPSVHDVGSALDISQWGALLRSVAGFHAFRRVHPRGMTAAAVSGFLLLNNRFPRSVAACIYEASRVLTALRRNYDLAAGEAAARRLSLLEDWMSERTIQPIMETGLHETLDWIQRELIAITGGLGEAFFGYPPPEAQAA
ncbi:MAG: alpha-E domain-containing protein [Alphaproteobacteria bacterium]